MKKLGVLLMSLMLLGVIGMTGCDDDGDNGNNQNDNEVTISDYVGIYIKDDDNTKKIVITETSFTRYEDDSEIESYNNTDDYIYKTKEGLFVDKEKSIVPTILGVLNEDGNFKYYDNFNISHLYIRQE